MAFQGDSIYWVEVNKVVPNPFQPRREFDEQKLRELSESVRMYGILQPLTVTRKEIERDDGTFYTEYELIAGERRLRASKLAGLSQVPVIIRDGEESEQEKLELAIIENLQREDLNAVDRALAFRQLVDVFGLPHLQVAKKVGRSREYVSNSIRLLALPDYMQSALRQAEISEGHARTLLMLNDRPEEQDVVFREILLKKLSVREVERIVRKIATDKVRKRDPNTFDTELIEIEKRFMETLGTRVQIQKTDYGGRLTIDYFAVEDLESMLARMKADGIEMKHSPAAKDTQLAALVLNTPLAMPTENAIEPETESANELTAERRVEEIMSDTDEEIMTDVGTVENLSTIKGKDSLDVIEHANEMVAAPTVQTQVVQGDENIPLDDDSDIHKGNDLVENLENMPDVAASTPFANLDTEVDSKPEEITKPAKEKLVEKVEEDESDLYSLRNFSI